MHAREMFYCRFFGSSEYRNSQKYKYCQCVKRVGVSIQHSTKHSICGRNAEWHWVKSKNKLTIIIFSFSFSLTTIWFTEWWSWSNVCEWRDGQKVLKFIWSSSRNGSKRWKSNDIIVSVVNIPCFRRSIGFVCALCFLICASIHILIHLNW